MERFGHNLHTTYDNIGIALAWPWEQTHVNHLIATHFALFKDLTIIIRLANTFRGN